MKPFPLTTMRRFEHLANINYAANTVANLPTQGGQIVDNRWLWGLHLVLEGRFTQAAQTGPSALNADGIPGMIERITMEGFSRIRQRNEKFFDMRGAELAFLTKLFYLNAFPSSTVTDFVADHTNDFRQHYILPFVPLGVDPGEQINYLLDVPNYETLKLTVQWGDILSTIGAYTTAPAFTAYGSTSGVPKLRVGGYWSLAGGGRFANRIPGRIFRYFQEVTGSTMTTTATGVRLIDIPRGNMIRSILLKTGVKSTIITAGNNAFASLSDSILANINIYRGMNRPIRYYPLQEQIRAETVLNRGYAGVAGYNYIDFSPNGVLGESLDARALVSGSSGQTDLYIGADITGASNQAAVVLYEEIQALPQATFAPRRR